MTALALGSAHSADHRRLTHDTTRWQRYLWDARTAAGAVSSALGAVRLAQGKAKGDTPEVMSDAGSVADSVDFGCEVYGRLYADPQRLDQPHSDVPWAGAAHDVLDGLPEWAALRESVAGDPDFAALAAAEMLSALAPRLPELVRAAEERAEEERTGTPTQRAPGVPDPAGAVRGALRRAIASAQGKVADGREALAGLAPGLESAPPTHEQADDARLRLAERLLAEPRLREVLRRAGRLTRLARDTRRQRDPHGRSEVVDLERGGDVARILPSQLAGLRAGGPLRLLALRAIVERGALQYRLEGTEPQGRGPIIVLLDRSGSMSGDPELWASATAIALLGAGARERRSVTVIEFTSTPDTCQRVSGNGDASRLDLQTAAYQSSIEGGMRTVALDLAGRRSCGGTNFGPVLRLAMQAGVRDDRADFVFVTDGQADCDEPTLDALVEAKSRGLRCYGLTVSGGSIAPSIASICDSSVDLDQCDDVAEAIAAAMPAV